MFNATYQRMNCFINTSDINVTNESIVPISKRKGGIDLETSGGVPDPLLKTVGPRP